MLVQNLHRIVRRPNITPGQIPHCTTDCIPINLAFQENFPANTQVRNSLCRLNNRRERGVIWVTNGCYNSNPKKVRITHKLATILVSSFDLACFFKIIWRHKCVDTVLYASDTCSVPCQTAALHELCWRAIFSLAYVLFCCTLYNVYNICKYNYL